MKFFRFFFSSRKTTEAPEMFAMQERFLAHQTKMQTETSSYGDASRSGVKNPPWALCVQRPSKTIKKFMTQSQPARNLRYQQGPKLNHLQYEKNYCIHVKYQNIHYFRKFECKTSNRLENMVRTRSDTSPSVAWGNFPAF